MTLRQQISDDMKQAMRDRDVTRLGTLRLLFSAVRQREIDGRVQGGGEMLDDQGVIEVIRKMIKQRQDSIAQYGAAGRQDLVDREVAEAKVLEAYLPAALSEAEVMEHVKAAILSTSASGMKDMGRVMAVVKTELGGRADMAVVSGLIKTALSG
ncbi:MAG TPA: GatB/YqeY domain-containing protein [Burkholderiales bacterium]|nr:GatB/YqeY domain-containing protein [Burkholderiales bacterium]